MANASFLFSEISCLLFKGFSMKLFSSMIGTLLCNVQDVILSTTYRLQVVMILGTVFIWGLDN